MKKRIFMCALALAMSLSLTACGGSSGPDSNAPAEATLAPEPKEITVDDLTITLTSDYGKSVTEEYDLYYSSASAICIGIRETKEELAENNITVNSINDYASFIMDKSGIESEVTLLDDNSAYFEWSKPIKDKEYSYIGYVTMAEESCWLIQFGCLSDSYVELKPDFLQYLDSVSVQ